MATWTNQTAASATFSNEQSASFVNGGAPIGLLLALTYSEYVGFNTYTNQTASSASWTNQSVN